jgi:hypothetical protein
VKVKSNCGSNRFFIEIGGGEKEHNFVKGSQASTCRHSDEPTVKVKMLE